MEFEEGGFPTARVLRGGIIQTFVLQIFCRNYIVDLILEIMGSSQEKSNFLKNLLTISIDYCDQSSSDNLYIKLLTSKT